MSQELTPTIIITRPAHQAGPLAQFVAELGVKPLIFPTLEIQPIADEYSVLTALQDINQYELVVFLSANAVDHAFALAKPHFSMPVIAIGPGTARALHAQGVYVDDIPALHHTEGLLTLPSLQQIRGKKIAIFCGENSRPVLKQTLSQRGALVDELPCYRRLCPIVDAKSVLTQWRKQAIRLIISTSSENLANLWKLFSTIDAEWLVHIPLMVISPKMAAQAKQLGFTSTIVTAGASDQAICAALKKELSWIKNLSSSAS